MKRFLIFGFLLLVLGLASGCGHLDSFLGPKQTVVVYNQGNVDSGDDYKKVVIKNPTPFWVLADVRPQSIIFAPGAKVTTKHIQPLGALSPAFGGFSFMAYAYRKYDGRRLSEFVGQGEFPFFLDGYARYYEGQIVGGIVEMWGFSVSTTGFPDRWKSRLFNLIPMDIQFLHR